MAAPKRRHCDGSDVKPLDPIYQVPKPSLDVIDLGLALPVLLRREVDDVARIEESTTVEDVHLTHFDFFTIAGSLVLAKHLRKGFLELQGNTLAHDAHRVHGIHQSLSIRLQNVAFDIF